MATGTLTVDEVVGLSAAMILGGEPVLHALPRSVLEWIALCAREYQPKRWSPQFR